MIKVVKIMVKDCKYLTSAQPIKFNGSQIKLDLDGIILTKKSHVSGIFLIIGHNADFTSSTGITRKKLSLIKQYMAQRVRGAFVCQPKASFDLFQTAQIVEFLSDNIDILNK